MPRVVSSDVGGSSDVRTFFYGLCPVLLTHCLTYVHVHTPVSVAYPLTGVCSCTYPSQRYLPTDWGMFMYIPQSALLTHCLGYVHVHTPVSVTYPLSDICTIIRDAEGRKKKASKVVQTPSKQHNTPKAVTFQMSRVGLIKPTYTHTSQCR